MNWIAGIGSVLLAIICGALIARRAYKRGRLDASNEIYVALFHRYYGDDDNWKTIVECVTIARGKS